MEYLVTGTEMKEYDKNTTERLQMPSLVLMERAALVTVEQIKQEKGDYKYRVLVVAGCGNNGGDGFAIGRLLLLQGYQVDFVLVGEEEKCSEETACQLAILSQYGHCPYDRIPDAEYDIVIDALFGVGLSRNIEGIYEEAVDTMNQLHCYVCSVDIPSGIHAGTGEVLGCAVRADLTVTYGFYKLGEFLYPGAGYCGKIICGQIGIDEYSFMGRKPYCYTYRNDMDIALPERRRDGNKGTFGKVLVIAGSDTVCGAALMACQSAFRMGAGMVKAVTSRKNRVALSQTVPEAMVTVYDTGLWEEEGPDARFLAEFETALSWADCILIGPGIGLGKEAEWMLRYCIEKNMLPMVVDADALNLLAENEGLLNTLRKSITDGRIVDDASKKEQRDVILTPHMAEFARLYHCTVPEAARNILQYPQELADKTQCVVVCKDVRTVVAKPQGDHLYINTTGNDGMATAGSGDVLAGMVTGLLVQGAQAADAAILGVYLHGVAGDLAAGRYGRYSMLARDIIGQIPDSLAQTGYS
ncbi:MAG: NAD(P)H-hydrate dehydratase [Lachnospiraceae bacterium]|nr:NAD(P)H-hydrate dehydratase [Lachnospiraceae bacterium]